MIPESSFLVNGIINTIIMLKHLEIGKDASKHCSSEFRGSLIRLRYTVKKHRHTHRMTSKKGQIISHRTAGYQVMLNFSIRQITTKIAVSLRTKYHNHACHDAAVVRSFRVVACTFRYTMPYRLTERTDQKKNKKIWEEHNPLKGLHKDRRPWPERHIVFQTLDRMQTSLAPIESKKDRSARM